MRCRPQALEELLGCDFLHGGEAGVAQRSCQHPEQVQHQHQQEEHRGGAAQLLDRGDHDAQKPRQHKTSAAPCGYIQQRAEAVQAQKAPQAHVQAPGQRSGHGAEAGDELGEEQRLRSALVERTRRAEDAGVGIQADLAEQRQQPPAGGASAEEHQGVSQQRREAGCENHQTKIQGAAVRRRARCQQHH